MNEPFNSRRTFLKNAAAGIAASGSLIIPENSASPAENTGKLPREVWIAGISQMEINKATYSAMLEKILQILEEKKNYTPDIICLPEVFPTSNVTQKYSLDEKLKIGDEAVIRFSEFARQNNCYVVCPVYTVEKEKAYNSAVLIDRKGNRSGMYHKIHLTEDEIEGGLTPGPVDPPVFKTDCGIVGVQICFDIMWDDGWTALEKKGAEIVFWPSAYAGGIPVNTKAWQHRYIVVSSTRKNTSKICDITGQVITQTGIWDKNYFCAPVNLEKAFLHTWPFVNRFDEIRKKYDRKIRITNFHEEEWSIIESLSPEIAVNDILKEFNLKSYRQHREDSEQAQLRAR